MKNKLNIFSVTILLCAGAVSAFGNSDKNNSGLTKETTYPSSGSYIENRNGTLFTQNKGQVADIHGKPCPDVLFKSSAAGAGIYLRKTGISYVYNNMDEITNRVNEMLRSENFIASNSIELNEEKIKQDLIKKETLKLHRIDMDFLNCNSPALLTSDEDEAEGSVNFYYPNCPKGVTDVKQYSKVAFRNLYNGIDLIYYSTSGKGLKYDLIVKPQADPGQIKLHWNGAENITLNNEGRLIIKTSVNEFYESIPRVYQIIDQRVKDVKARYVLNGTTVQFEFGTLPDGRQAWDPAYPLIIDPLTWITYYGGNDDDQGASVTGDGSGNAIFSGRTLAMNFPTSAGAYQTTLAGAGNTYDAFVVKMNSNGGRVFATYFGGGDFDYGYGLTCDKNNDIYVSGYTQSTNFPTMTLTGAFMQATNAGGDDVYLAKFSPSGALLWSTYYGGLNDDHAFDVITDTNGDVVLTGFAKSTNFPTLNPYQNTLQGTYDAIIIKFDNAGVLKWATYFGGSSIDIAYGITVDSNKNIFVCGYTSSANFPTLSAFQGTSGGGQDAFLFCLNTTTGFPTWSTYYGGTGVDQATAITTDKSGNIFMGLSVQSSNNISTAGAFQTTFNGGNSDAGLIKFSNSGSRLWGTYLGGNLADLVTGLSVNVDNKIVVTGDSYSTNFPVTSCAFQKIFQGTSDQFISTFDTNCNLICSGYLGKGIVASPPNKTTTGGGSSAVNGNFVYLASTTTCNYPVTPGAFQTACGGGAGADAAFSKLCIYSSGLPAGKTGNFASLTSVCVGVGVNFTVADSLCDTTAATYLWTFTGSVQNNSSAKNPSGITWNSAGTYSVSVKIMSPCDTFIVSKPGYITINTCGCNISSVATVVSNVTCNNGSNGSASVNTSNGTGPYTYSWSAPGGTSQTMSGLSAGTYTVTVIDGLSCTATSTVTITSPPPFVPTISVNGNVLTASAGNSYQWNLNGSPISGANAQIYAAIVTGNYSVTETDANGCTGTSAIESVTITLISSADYVNRIELFPNPNSGSFTLTIQNAKNENTCLSIMDQRGRIVHTEIIPLLSGKNSSVIDLYGCASGIYTLRLVSSNGVVNKKIILQ